MFNKHAIVDLIGVSCQQKEATCVADRCNKV